MKKVLVILFMLILSWSSSFSQAAADSSYLRKINFIEQKVATIKSLPKEDQKQYLTILSDVENRKNTLKSLLKIPIEKRDKIWDNDWNLNYLKAASKLENIPSK